MTLHRLLAGLVFLAAATCESTPGDLRDLLAKYECTVADRLRRAHDGGDPAAILDHAVWVGVPDGPTAKCMFLDRLRLLYCEVSPNLYASRARQPAAVTVDALAALGFEADPSGYSSLRRPVDATPDYDALATLMLKALYAGYGARAATPIAIRATFEPPPGATVCAVR